MADLRLEHIYKVYPNGVKAVNDFTMDIKDKEFIVFVGPSGCGKSTTLRMIAGLEDITAGELYIGDQIVNDMEPKDRDIAMVFQNYALYPHMTVYENMAFGLRLRHLPADEIHEKVLWAADILGLREYLDRKPKAMSGGQRQRVSLGRAILRNPKVMLLDEPLSNLDAKLRSQMRSEISKLHQKLGTTFIYVTHDQVEAMTLGTRVVVMKLGRIQQIDTPKNLYDYPINKFVAGFIGTPQMNFFSATLKKNGDNVNVTFQNSDAKLTMPYVDLIKIKSSYLNGDKKVCVGIRCEDISIEEDDVKNCKELIDVKVSHFEELGNETLIYGDINMEGDGFGETETRVILKASSRHGLEPGDVVKAAFNMSKAHFFDTETEVSIKPRIPEDNLATITIKDNKINIYGNDLDLPNALNIREFAGDVVVPNDAIILNSKGINAKVIKVEQVNAKYVNYLESKGNVFFVTTDEEHKVGETLDLTFDFSKIVIRNENEVLNDVIPEKDEFLAHFNNLPSVISTTKDESLNSYKDENIKVVNDKFDSEIAKTVADFDAKIEDAKNLNYLEIQANNATKLAEKIADVNEKLAAIKAETKTKIAEENARHKAAVKEIKATINAEYDRRIKEENDDYKSIIANNKDKDVIFERKQEHRIFKENTPNEKANDLENKITSENLDHGATVTALRVELKRVTKQLKLELKEFKDEVARENDLVNYLTKEKETALTNIEKERTKALTQAGLVFFFKFNDAENFVHSPEVITNKLIQGLGTKVFNKTYLFRVPHTAYIEASEGIHAVVEDTLDYGVRKFVKALIKGTTNAIYVETTKDYKVGDEIILEINLIDTEIIENGLKIRLY